MSYKERDIIHENGNYWVCRDKKQNMYIVFKNVIYETATQYLSECMDTLEYAKAAHNVTGECVVFPYDGDLY